MTAGIDTPVGRLRLSASEIGLDGLYFDDGVELGRPDHPILDLAIRQLDEYFAGTRQTFDIPLDLKGTDFQRRVWAQLMQIPYGHTISYGALAVRCGDPKAVRAAAGANGRNPVSIIVPCHRVIAANGSPHGYGGGIERKIWLLNHEHPRLPGL